MTHASEAHWGTVVCAGGSQLANLRCGRSGFGSVHDDVLQFRFYVWPQSWIPSSILAARLITSSIVMCLRQSHEFVLLLSSSHSYYTLTSKAECFLYWCQSQLKLIECRLCLTPQTLFYGLTSRQHLFSHHSIWMGLTSLITFFLLRAAQTHSTWIACFTWIKAK